MNEILSYIAAAIGATGGVGFVLVLIGRFSEAWAQMRIKAREAASADTFAEANKDNALVEQLRRAEERLDKLEAKQHNTEVQRDAAIEESNAYRIALEQSEAKYLRYQQETDKRLEVLQNEIAVVRSENGGFKARQDGMQEMFIKMQATIDKALGDRDNLAKELESERTQRLNLERVAAKQREQHAIEITWRDAKLEVYEKLTANVQLTASESTDALPSQEGGEPKEAVDENQ